MNNNEEPVVPVKKARKIKNEILIREKKVKGEAHINHKGRVIEAKKVGPDCKCKRYKCFSVITEDKREQILKEFYAIPTKNLQDSGGALFLKTPKPPLKLKTLRMYKISIEDPNIALIRKSYSGPWGRCWIRNKTQIPTEFAMTPSYAGPININPLKTKSLIDLCPTLSKVENRAFYESFMQNREEQPSQNTEIDSEENSSGCEKRDYPRSEKIQKAIHIFCMALWRKWKVSHGFISRFMQKNIEWLNEEFITSGTVQCTPSGLGSAGRGRPKLLFAEASQQTKRRREQQIVESTGKEELFVAAQMKLHSCGNRNAAVVVHKVTNSPKISSDPLISSLRVLPSRQSDSINKDVILLLESPEMSSDEEIESD
ncbi:hypothetical protein NQ314_021136 [Rhamnusium bicolor]|uniref:Uncharacterized protein n=1 Tax=Rhamnusium bicolor TaxID=1586634 RepID=A0AAV8WJ49_9CUCU|nr:hypothetical protein NQ314_021136 [Rhamnusium bicolor]